jgi:hypothetical protein
MASMAATFNRGRRRNAGMTSEWADATMKLLYVDGLCFPTAISLSASFA